MEKVILDFILDYLRKIKTDSLYYVRKGSHRISSVRIKY